MSRMHRVSKTVTSPPLTAKKQWLDIGGRVVLDVCLDKEYGFLGYLDSGASWAGTLGYGTVVEMEKLMLLLIAEKANQGGSPTTEK